jgi:putative transposase
MRENESAGRRRPASGVVISFAEPTIVFVTVCSEKRVPWIAQAPVHEFLKEVWTQADAWLVGYYQLMPDHIHLFAAPRNLGIPFNRWMSYWKGLFTRKAQQLSRTLADGRARLPTSPILETSTAGRANVPSSPIENPANWRWQSLHWDTRLRRSENYSQKWHYIRENPVKSKLIPAADDWPYQGMLNVLPW